MVRRFIIYDTISGLRDESSFKDGIKPPSYVRWASSLTLKLTSDPQNPGQIFRPFVIIKYQERNVVDLS